MNIAMGINIVLILFCIAVLVQCSRVLQKLNAIRNGDLPETIKQLDRAMGQARHVLGELRTMLSTEGQACTRIIANGEILRDELSVMVGIGNAVAERIVETAAQSRAKPKTPRKTPKKKPVARKTAAPKTEHPVVPKLSLVGTR